MTRKYQISDLMLEKYLLDELEGDSRQKIQLAIQSKEESVVERLRQIKDSNQDILTHFPVKEMSSQIQHRIRKESNAGKSSFSKFVETLRGFILANGLNRLVYVAVTLAFCFPGYFALNRYSHYSSNLADLEDTRLKGVEPHLTVYRKIGTSFEQLQNQAIVKANDLLQISYFSVGSSYGVILSVDGRGSVTVHLPSASERAVPLIAQKEVVLPTAFELDNAPLFDRFYFFTSNEPFLIAPVVEAIRVEKGNSSNETSVKGISSHIRQYSITLKRTK